MKTGKERKKAKAGKKTKNYNLSGKRVHHLRRWIFLVAVESGIVLGVPWVNFTSIFGQIVGRNLNEACKTFINPVSVLVGAIVFVWWLMEYAHALEKESKKYMHGNEMGSAKWGVVEEFNEKYEDKEHPEKNMILTQNVRKMYDKKTRLNNNVTVVGGSGTGKTAGFIAPNLLQGYGCNVYTDPKGDTLRDFAPALEKMGIPVKVLDLCDFSKSMQFNPFRYITEEAHVDKLIDNIIANTTPKEAKEPEPFWKEGEKLCEKALFFYVWLECPQPYFKYTQVPIGEDSEEIDTEKGVVYRTAVRDSKGNQRTLDRTMRSFMLFLGEAEINEDEQGLSELDCRFLVLRERLKQEGRLPEDHKAVDNFKRIMGGAKDTVRSIVLSVNARFTIFNTEKVLRLFDDDDMELETIGIKQQALFLKIPDEDTTYNVVVGMLYTQLFQTMYRVARLYDNFLPVPVGIWMDEFANIKMPEDFEKILATIRSRNGYIVIFLQSLAQLKVLYPNDAHEGVLGNCDVFIYLGGNEKGSQKYVSEVLGKWTIDKRTDSQTLGRQGSSSLNNDILGRELMTEDEVAMLSNQECIIKVRGTYPIRDRKCFWFENPAYDYVKKLEPYRSKVVVKMEGNRMVTVKYESPYRVLREEELSNVSGDVKVQEMHPIDLLMEDVIEEELEKEDWEELRDKGVQLYKEINVEDMDQAIEQEVKAGEKEMRENALSRLLETSSFDDEQMEIIVGALEEGVDIFEIEKFAKPEKSAAQMRFMMQLVQGTK